MTSAQEREGCPVCNVPPALYKRISGMGRVLMERVLNDAGHPVKRSEVERHIRKSHIPLYHADEVVTEESVEPPEQTARVDIDLDGTAKVRTGWTEEKDHNRAFAHVFERFGMDADAWDIVTYKASTWEQSKRLENGDRDTILLHSYKASFQPRVTAGSGSAYDNPDTLAWVKSWKPGALTRRTLGTGLGDPVTFVYAQGDDQAGKSEGYGIEGLMRRFERTLERATAELERLMRTGVNVSEIADLFTGDQLENIIGHYANQPKTTSTLRLQFDAATDIDLKRTEIWTSFGLPVKKAYTISNHGEMRLATGAAPITSASDNLDLIAADFAKKITDRTPWKDQLEYFIPHDEWMTTLVLSGIDTGLSHGHHAKGDMSKWLVGQRDYQLWHFERKIKLFVTGHLHTFGAKDIGGSMHLQSGSQDGGSDWFTARSGLSSDTAAVVATVGTAHHLGIANITPV